MEDRLYLKNKKRIVIKIGSSSLIHEETGGLDYIKLEKLVRIISDLKNQDKDILRCNRCWFEVVRAPEKAKDNITQTGMCSSWTGTAHDGIPASVL